MADFLAALGIVSEYIFSIAGVFSPAVSSTQVTSHWPPDILRYELDATWMEPLILGKFILPAVISNGPLMLVSVQVSGNKPARYDHLLAVRSSKLPTHQDKAHRTKESS
jgi:hypothetical protein